LNDPFRNERDREAAATAAAKIASTFE